jgi:hypothetical protein
MGDFKELPVKVRNLEQFLTLTSKFGNCEESPVIFQNNYQFSTFTLTYI